MFLAQEVLAPYVNRRNALRRRAVNKLRAAVHLVPQLGDVAVFLRYDPVVQDAVATLHAMGFDDATIASYVKHPRFNSSHVCLILSSHVCRQLLLLLRVAK